MFSRVPVVPVVAAFALTAAACGGSQPQPESSSAPAADHGVHAGGGKVFFMEPMNGATVKSPVRLVFGSEMVTISPVPPGELKETRPNVAHYHLGVDTDCLPPGTVIPKANPWVHFGDGKNTIDMQLSPGPHKLAVQAGDDLHATVAGLCETINITVTE
jgi:Domain of unknown function (DUF4399)